jgi:uncharacterized protein YjiS (DUF1127 family)
MSGSLLTFTRPAAAPRLGTLSRLLGAFGREITRYGARREAIARLRDFDDAELRDIGLRRSQIERAVCGLPVLPDWPRR